MWIKVFGFVLAGGVVLTSLAMAWSGGRWQKIEASAYAGKTRPSWFWALSFTIIGLYTAALFSFLSADKSWAGWLLIVVIPVGWLLKAGLVTLNPKGRQTVSFISGDQAWTTVALARLPVAVILGLLAYFS